MGEDLVIERVVMGIRERLQGSIKDRIILLTKIIAILTVEQTSQLL